MKHNIDENLSTMKIKTLTKQERDQIWQRISSTAREPIGTSGFILFKFVKKPLVWGALTAAFILVGSVATVSASNSAKPGDFLFSIDRAIENIQLSLASDQKKTDLKLKMVQERLDEVQAILAQTNTTDDDNKNPADTSQAIGTTSASTTNQTQSSATNHTPNKATTKDQKRVEDAFAYALDFIATIKADLAAKNNAEAVDAIDLVISKLDMEIDELPSKWKFEIKQNKDKYKVTLDIKTQEGTQKLKIKQNGDKIDIDYKDEEGKTKVKIKDDDVKVKDKQKGKKKNKKEKDKDDHDNDDEDEDDDKDTTPPTLKSLSPQDSATNVATDTNLILTFSENVMRGSGSLSIKKASDDSTVKTISVNTATGSGTNTITFNPSSNLPYNTELYVLLDEGSFKDKSLNKFAGIKDVTVWNFITETEPDTTNPTVTAFSPLDNASNVATDTNLILTFSENVTAASGTIVIKKGSDDSIVETINAASTTGSGSSTITINPNADLASNTEYYVQITGNAFKDAAGNAYAGIANNTTWNFTTKDIVPPVISEIVTTATASTTATITWTTNEDADSKSSYGTSTPVTTDPPFIVVSNTSLTTSHSINLIDLLANTTYNFIVISKDASGNETTSAEQSFTTPAL